jgi:hypothetical protein
MVNRPKSYRWLALLAMLVVLFSATEQVAWHNHDSTPVDRCPICHLGHLPAVAPTAIAQLPAPHSVHRAASPQQIPQIETEVARHFSPRAPPALS